jgi:Ribonuclease HII
MCKVPAMAKSMSSDSRLLFDLPEGPDFLMELAARKRGLWPVAGTDEAGRGPLAGPVVAAAVVLDPKNIPEGLHDSKQLSAAKRESLFALIMQSAFVSVASSCSRRIDVIDIRKASLDAMRRAVAGLEVAPKLVLADGRRSHLPRLRLRPPRRLCHRNPPPRHRSHRPLPLAPHDLSSAEAGLTPHTLSGGRCLGLFGQRPRLTSRGSPCPSGRQPLPPSPVYPDNQLRRAPQRRTPIDLIAMNGCLLVSQTLGERWPVEAGTTKNVRLVTVLVPHGTAEGGVMWESRVTG